MSANPSPVPGPHAAEGSSGKARTGVSATIDAFLANIGQQPNPIVPRATVIGRSLTFVTAIMCFLACISLGTAWSVHKAARAWTIDASREVTVQIKPVEGMEADKQISEVMRVLGETSGIVRSRVFTLQENAQILEPWLGKGLDLGELPIPRLISLQLDPVVPADLGALAHSLTQRVPGATVDDHRVWQAQVRSVSRSVQLAAFLILTLMLGATVAIIVFATRGAMASNRDIVNVLHLVGARQSFIAREFQRHFLMLGLRGGLIGGAAAALAFVATRAIAEQIAAPLGGDAYGPLIEALSIGYAGYGGIAGIVTGLGLLSAVTSRVTVFRYLRGVE